MNAAANPNLNAFLREKAISATMSAHHLGHLIERKPELLRALQPFHPAETIMRLASMLLEPQNHPSTIRIEALIHLARFACQGSALVSPSHLRKWLNNHLLQDEIGTLEDPAEDVFTSNVTSWIGNSTLFNGSWPDNHDYYVQSVIDALNQIPPSAWATAARASITALLRISDTLAHRTNATPGTMTTGTPGQSISIRPALLKNAASQVVFTEADLAELDITLHDLDPFLYRKRHKRHIPHETLGHSSFEKHPLLRFRDGIVVALPTAIGTAIIRYAMEEASRADAIATIETAIVTDHLNAVFRSANNAWEIPDLTRPSNQPLAPLHFFKGEFDNDSITHIVYICDNLSEIASAGLHTSQVIPHEISDVIDREIGQQDETQAYRRGLTILVHGGLGRGFSMDLPRAARDWHYLAMPISDFTRVAWNSELNALRAWRLLQQQRHFQSQATTTLNLGGFLNYFEYRRSMGFRLLPYDDTPGPMPNGLWLLTDYLVRLRHRTRRQTNRHVALGPDQSSWIEVQHKIPEAFFPEDSKKSTFVSASHIAQRQLLGCTETPAKVWWISCDATPIAQQNVELAYNVWHMALQWMSSLAIHLESRIPSLPPGPTTISLEFPQINDFQPDYTDAIRESHPPSMHASGTTVTIRCTSAYLYNFMKPENVADRLMLSAIIRGVYILCSLKSPDDDVVNEFLRILLPHEHASHFRMLPAYTPSDLVASTTEAPEPRLVAPEDRVWSSMNLASRSGWTGSPGAIPQAQAAPLLNESVDVLWRDLKAQLQTLSRKSVITRALTNLEAIERDRHRWRSAAGALTGIHRDQDAVVEVTRNRESQRSLAAIASRVVVEMAVCTCPANAGLSCSDIDFDRLIATVASLLESATQSDALRHGLSVSLPIVETDGAFRFNFASNEILSQYFTAHGENEFQQSVDRYRLAFRKPDSEGSIDPGFDNAFNAEFGLSLQQYYDAVGRFTDEAIDRGSPVICKKRDEVLHCFQEVGVERPFDTYATFALLPRTRWDDPNPTNADKRDWYPWRHKRRLSLIRRPLVQLSTADDPDVLVTPTLLDTSLRYLYESFDGRLPVRLFDSPEMKTWIGRAVDRDGHEFNRQVAERLGSLGWETHPELKMSELGGGSDLGDIDVLAWCHDSGAVFAIECKRLFTDRTVGEIGERLAEYSIVADADDKTPLQRHIDRILHLKNNIQVLSSFTSISSQKIRLASGLVTDRITPMQFSSEVSRRLDVVTDFENIQVHFSHE